MTVIRANAKLTWSLRVVGRRDDGYHLIDAEMVTLDLADTLTIEPAATSTLTVAGPFADGVPIDASNLLLKALAAVNRSANVHVDKRIPHGGGLGGGSADAAAILRWAQVDDLDVAAAVGADVPFCLVGGRARVTGIGEIVDPLPPIERSVTLVVPPLNVSTPAVYRAWDDLGGPTAVRAQRPRAGSAGRRAATGEMARPHRRVERADAETRRERIELVRRG